METRPRTPPRRAPHHPRAAPCAFAALTALTALAALAVLTVGCIERPVAALPPTTQSGVALRVEQTGVEKLDLLLLVDNSNSMTANQENIMARFADMVRTLTKPDCRSRTNPDVLPHTCDPANPDDVPAYPPVKDMHLGVVSSDLGTPGTRVETCAARDYGDDGLLNPLGRLVASDGFTPLAIQSHLPWNSNAPATFRPEVCRGIYEGSSTIPAFLTFMSATGGTPGTDPDAFAASFQCMAGIYVNGCGLEQQLEAVYRALVVHGADKPAGTPGAPNAGFLRDDALLAVVILSDEEDGSVRICDPPSACTDARDVYIQNSTRWAHANRNMRFYMYQPGSTHDPTWDLDRYIDPDPTHYPADPANNVALIPGLMRVKPGHPERVLFAGIIGVPPETGGFVGDNFEVDWDLLLGPPGPGGANDYNGRQSNLAYDNPMNVNGHIAMRQAYLDPRCNERVVPACRRVGQAEPPYNPSDPSSVTNYCATTGQYFASPGRRIVEVARRFEQARLCQGSPCENGLVTSICAADYRPAITAIIKKIQSRLQVPCLPRRLQYRLVLAGDRATELRRVDCRVLEEQPRGVTGCDAARGRVDPRNMAGRSVATTAPNGRTVCEVEQVLTYEGNGAGEGRAGAPQRASDGSLQPGWYYNTAPDPNNPRCTARITYTEGSEPALDTITTLECIQAVTGAGSSGDAGGAEGG